MLGDLENQMKAAEQYGNIIDPRSIATAKIFGDTVARIKTMAQSFGDTVRSGVLRYITPLVIKLQDWIAANRELIRDKIDGFIRRAGEALYNFIGIIKSLSPAIKTIIARTKSFAVSAISAIKTIIPWVKSAIDFFAKFGPAILTAYAAFTVFSTVVTMINAVSAALALMGTALTIATGPLGLIAAALAAIGVGIGLIALKSKQAISSGISATRDEHLKAARMMVAENQASRIEAARLGHTGQAAALTNQDLLAISAADSRQVNGFRMSAEEAARERGQQSHFQIASPVARQVGNLSLDEALQVQARKWANEDLFNRNNLWGEELAKYISDNPDAISYEEALKRLREDAATDSAGGGMDPELKRMMEEIEKYLAQINGGVKSLGDAGAQGVPGRLNYAAMGREDFWELARSGI
jgi:hypothetical protein